MAKTEYDSHIKEIQALFDLIKMKDFVFIRDQALRNWLKDRTDDEHITTKAWTIAVTTMLIANGYEIKKKA